MPLKQLRNESLKKKKKHSGLKGIQTHDLCDASAVLYQLSYQANWELVILWVRNHYTCGQLLKLWVFLQINL